MANPDPSRTEWPTAKKLNETRQGGNVLTCPDVTSGVVILGGFLSLFLTVPFTADAFRDIFHNIFLIDCRESWSDSQVCMGVSVGTTILVKVLLPACFAICLVALLVMRAQVGRFFSFKPLKFNMNRVWNPKSALRDIIPHKDSLIRFLISGLKVSLVGSIVYMSIRKDMPEIEKLNMLPLWSGINWVVWEIFFLVMKIMAFYIIIAAASYYYNYKRYYDGLMMTKFEVKDERKNQDGDPYIKAKIRGKMREIFIRSMKGNIRQANVVVTNPTHVAVALKYDPDKDAAPMVVAKGLRIRAQRIKDLARFYGIPTVEAPPLARSLYRNVKVGSFIPPEFYRAVAAILAKLHKGGVKTVSSILKRKTA